MSYPDNFIVKDQPDELDLECRTECPKAPGWLPVEVYDLIQSGYPYPDHVEMILRVDGGTNRTGQLMPPDGMWCKSEDVRRVLHDLHVLVAWAQGEISEGMATALLGVERVEARGVLQETTAAGVEAARQWREAHPPVLPHIPTPEETDEHVE